MRSPAFTEARSHSEPWGKSPPHDLDIVLGRPEVMVELAELIQRVRGLPPTQLASIDRGAVVRDILTRHGFQPYTRLTQMLLQLIRRQSRA